MRARSTSGDGSGGSEDQAGSDHRAEMKRRGGQQGVGPLVDPLVHSSSAVRARSREERERERERNRIAADGSAASASSMNSGGGGGGMLAPFQWSRPLMSAAAASAASSAPYDVPLLRSTPQIVLSVTMQIAAVQSSARTADIRSDSIVLTQLPTDACADASLRFHVAAVRIPVRWWCTIRRLTN